MKFLEGFNILVTGFFLIFAVIIAFWKQLLPAWFWTNPPLTVLYVAAPLFAYASIAFVRALVLYASGVVERASPQQGYDFTMSLAGYGCAGFVLALAFAFGRPEHVRGLEFFAAVVSLGAIGFGLFCACMSLSTPWFERLEKEKGGIGARP